MPHVLHRLSIRFARSVFMVLTALLCSRIAHAQTYSLVTLASFDGTNGAMPSGKLILSGGMLYGTTSSGGDGGNGTVFSLPVVGGTPTVLTSFHGSDGANPVAGLTLAGGFLYGTTENGGAFGYGTAPDGTPLSGYGTVFSLPITGGTPTTLVNFNRTNGAYPTAGLTQIGITLYGATSWGGVSSAGTVFSVSMNGDAPTTLVNFASGAGSGMSPFGGLTPGGDGMLYGTTASGGPNRDGTVYSVPFGGGTPTLLSNFNRSTGYFPHDSLTLIGSNLYGVAGVGGDRNLGTIFSVPVSGGTPTVLASFYGTVGTYPSGDLTLIGSTLYGTTRAGGASETEGEFSDDGTVFSVPLTGGAITPLISFHSTDGSSPHSGVTLGSDGILYGTTQTGGDFGDGTVFALVPTPEPSPGATLGTGLLGIIILALNARKRRAV